KRDWSSDVCSSDLEAPDLRDEDLAFGLPGVLTPEHLGILPIDRVSLDVQYSANRSSKLPRFEGIVDLAAARGPRDATQLRQIRGDERDPSPGVLEDLVRQGVLVVAGDRLIRDDTDVGSGGVRGQLCGLDSRQEVNPLGDPEVFGQ